MIRCPIWFSHSHLHHTACLQQLEDYRLVSFLTLNIKDEDNIIDVGMFPVRFCRNTFISSFRTTNSSVYPHTDLEVQQIDMTLQYGDDLDVEVPRDVDDEDYLAEADYQWPTE